MRGKGKLPVADYTLATNIMDAITSPGGGGSSRGGGIGGSIRSSSHGGKSSSSTASSSSNSGGGAAEGVAVAGGGGGGSSSNSRGVYSFCMCPGGRAVRVRPWRGAPFLGLPVFFCGDLLRRGTHATHAHTHTHTHIHARTHCRRPDSAHVNAGGRALHQRHELQVNAAAQACSCCFACVCVCLRVLPVRSSVTLLSGKHSLRAHTHTHTHTHTASARPLGPTLLWWWRCGRQTGRHTTPPTGPWPASRCRCVHVCVCLCVFVCCVGGWRLIHTACT